MKRFLAVCAVGGLLIGLCAYGVLNSGGSGDSALPTEAESTTAEPVEEVISEEFEEPEEPAEEGYSSDELVDMLSSGEITIEILESMVATGEVSYEIYEEVLSIMKQ